MQTWAKPRMWLALETVQNMFITGVIFKYRQRCRAAAGREETRAAAVTCEGQVKEE